MNGFLKKYKSSIRVKLFTWIFFSFLVLLAVLTGSVYFHDRNEFTQSMIIDLEISAKIIGHNSTSALIFKDKANAIQILDALKAKENIMLACIYDENDSVFATYKRSDISKAVYPESPLKIAPYFTKEALIVFHEINFQDEFVGTVYIKSNLETLKKQQTRFLLYLGIYLFSMVIIAVILYKYSERLIIAPLQDLVSVSRKISHSKDYSARASKKSTDEVGQLTDSFNLMLAQIQERDIALQKTHEELMVRARELQTELTERRMAEMQLTSSLKEKEVLLKEIHHRVKNNLQIISSLIYLQSRGLKDPETLKLFQESQNRVKSMALIHEKLYQSKDLAQLDFSEYIHTLVDHLFSTYNINSNVISLKLKIDNLPLTIDMAIYCGIIINELISNSLKHAFQIRDKQQGEITIKLHAYGPRHYQLIVRDNGVGFPPDFDLKKAKTLGLQLVNNLTDQLGGKVDLTSDEGTTFCIIFPYPK